jgi:hypothetical protein
MFSRIQDLERYKLDQKRFKLAIDSTYGDVKEEGNYLLSKLTSAVENFDDATKHLLLESSDLRNDHASAQQAVHEAKVALEAWVTLNAPNVHVETMLESDK